MDIVVFEVFKIGLQITVVGLVVVFVALALLAWMLSYFDKIDTWVTQRGTKSHDKAVESVTDETIDKGISPEIIAVISAAVAEAIGGKTRIKHVRYRRQVADPTWQTQGRATIMASHTITRPKHQ